MNLMTLCMCVTLNNPSSVNGLCVQELELQIRQLLTLQNNKIEWISYTKTVLFDWCNIFRLLNLLCFLSLSFLAFFASFSLIPIISFLHFCNLGWNMRLPKLKVPIEKITCFSVSFQCNGLTNKIVINSFNGWFWLLTFVFVAHTSLPYIPCSQLLKLLFFTFNNCQTLSLASVVVN